jgi:hypothetical protein
MTDDEIVYIPPGGKIPDVTVHFMATRLDDGAMQYSWLMTTEHAAPRPEDIPPEALHGPFKTLQLCEADAERVLDMLGKTKANVRKYDR